MLSFDVRNLTDPRREEMALKARKLKDFDLPAISGWNYSPCRVHARGWEEKYQDPTTKDERTRTVYDRPAPLCRKCGVQFRKHQRVGVAWLYLKKRALLADTMGSGKTITLTGLVGLLRTTGELPQKGRVVIIPRAAALYQWYNEILRMIPNLDVAIAVGTKSQRRDIYAQNWEVLLIGPEMVRQDIGPLSRLKLAAVITDDISQMSNAETETSRCIDRLGMKADRFVMATGTPIQKNLPEMYNILDGIGGERIFGSKDSFINRYVRKEFVDGKSITVGYRNISDFKRRVSPLYLRRTAAHLDDVTLPTINPDDVLLELYPSQRSRYDDLKREVVRLLAEEGMQTKHVTALSKIHYGSAICAGLAALDGPEHDGPGTSVKLDWTLEKVSVGGDLGDEKVVIFANLKNTVRALQTRLSAEGIGYVTVWGEEKNKKLRSDAQEKFWRDPNCRVLIGTKAIEQSLNLQVSRHLINIDLILNPARMEQLAGRIRRDGSAYQHVFVHNLLAIDTQETRYMAMIEREAALASHIFEEESELFRSISPIDLLKLISG